MKLGEKNADSKITELVSISTAESKPPITPARARGAFLSAINKQS